MSYRRKKLLALFCATALSMTAVAGCTGTKSSTGNVVSSETETNAEETSAQSEAGTFSSADMFTERIWQEPMRRVGQFMSHFPMMVSQGKRMAL